MAQIDTMWHHGIPTIDHQSMAGAAPTSRCTSRQAGMASRLSRLQGPIDAVLAAPDVIEEITR